MVVPEPGQLADGIRLRQFVGTHWCLQQTNRCFSRKVMGRTSTQRVVETIVKPDLRTWEITENFGSWSNSQSMISFFCLKQHPFPKKTANSTRDPKITSMGPGGSWKRSYRKVSFNPRWAPSASLVVGTVKIYGHPKTQRK